MTDVSISAAQPTPGTLIEAAYAAPDYSDAFKIVSATNVASIEDFATGFFLSQPTWLAKVSMNLGGQASRTEAIGGGDYVEGGSVGSWKIHGRTDNEIMFGEHMGFMEYRFSMLHRPDGHIEAATSVKYLKRLGHVYFAIVKPFHVGFTKVALRNAAARAVGVGSGSALSPALTPPSPT